MKLICSAVCLRNDRMPNKCVVLQVLFEEVFVVLIQCQQLRNFQATQTNQLILKWTSAQQKFPYFLRHIDVQLAISSKKLRGNFWTAIFGDEFGETT